MSREYQAFLAGKRPAVPAVGFDVPTEAFGTGLFPFQAAITAWMLRGGRRACFASTGLGKTRQQVAAAHQIHQHTGENVLILAPLAVAQQTIAEASAIGIDVRYCRHQADVRPGITITNYDMLHAFEPDGFSGVILDESGILKSHDSTTRQYVTDAFRATPYRLAFTATPAPNDIMEIGNHAEFLGIMTQAEMLSMYFVHDGGSTKDWRLKRHARADFWRWLASWSVLVRLPSDIGYDDTGYVLPALQTHEHRTEAETEWATDQGYLFAPTALSLTQFRQARKASIDGRVDSCAALVNNAPGQWLVWCDLNAEGDALTAAIPGAVQVAGSDTRDDKAGRMLDFAAGKIRVLVTKASIAGHGMNWQNCHQMAFVGVNWSYESYYQAVRRCWRYGQTQPVDVHLFLSDAEAGVLADLRGKEAAADEMAGEMLQHMRETMRHNLGAQGCDRLQENAGIPMRIPAWLAADATAAVFAR